MQLHPIAIANAGRAQPTADGPVPSGLAAGLLAVRAVGGGDGLAGVLALLDLAEVPDGQGGDPAEDEGADDGEPGLVDVEVAHEVPEPAGQPVPAAAEAEDLDGADEDGDEDRQAGEDEVVLDLADGLGQRPVVGEVHEAAVEGAGQAHPGGDQTGRYTGCPAAVAAGPTLRAN